MSHEVYVYCYRANDGHASFRWKCSCSKESKAGANWPSRETATKDGERHAR